MAGAGDEHVIFRGHPSWRSRPWFYVRGFLIAGIAGVLAGLASAVIDGKVQVEWVAVIVLAVFAATLARGLAGLRRTSYTLTTHRLRVTSGLLARDTREIRLEHVQGVRARQSPLERVLRVGSVELDAGEPGAGFALRGVEEPQRLARTVEQARRELRGGSY